jgi:hypothetical protein
MGDVIRSHTRLTLLESMPLLYLSNHRRIKEHGEYISAPKHQDTQVASTQDEKLEPLYIWRELKKNDVLRTIVIVEWPIP